jgi:hypothetical protein
VIIQGILSTLQEGAVIQLYQLSKEDLHLDDEDEVISNSETPVEISETAVEIQKLLSTYSDIFASKVQYPPPRSCSHSIPLLSGSRPVVIRPHRYAPLLKNEIENQVQEMLEAGLIHNSSSPFFSPVLFVKKKDGSYRFCVDYCHLNAITEKEQYPMPVIDEFLDELHGASWFSSLDLCAGFHQIPMTPTDYFKTTFQTHVGHYEFKVMSFELTGAPHTFQKAMNSTLAPLLRKCALVFFDDILIYSKSYGEHVQHLEQVFKILQEQQWRVKLSKRSFAQRVVSYLGYVINQAGVSTCPAKNSGSDELANAS